MRKLLTAALALCLSVPAWAGTVPPDSTIFPGMTSQPLLDSLVSKFKASSNLGYNSGRDTMYGEIDIVGDSLRCVYLGLWIHGGPTAAPRTWINNNGFNCEHTWPQSMLSGIAVSDLHHLYPTEADVNNARGNLPFAELDDSTQVTRWYRYDHYNPYLTTYPPDHWEEYSKLQSISTAFEPRDDHKGRVARSMMYVFTMYKSMYPDTGSFWLGQKSTLYAWHVTHPASAAEISRTRKIAMHQQGKVNPFIMDSTLARRAFFPGLGVAGSPAAVAPPAALAQNSPNPFRGTTRIRYTLSRPAAVQLGIYDVLGREVFRTARPGEPAGSHEITWDGRALPQGVYFCRLTADGAVVATRRMTLVR
ncbi:MAG: endonuclease [Candidatus Edwardsbacteria bacterium]|nr:endonuclease [Candidatus Edwardsbacteria bacterium]